MKRARCEIARLADTTPLGSAGRSGTAGSTRRKTLSNCVEIAADVRTCHMRAGKGEVSRSQWSCTYTCTQVICYMSLSLTGLLSQVLVMCRRYRDAEAKFQEALRYDPNDWQALANFGVLLVCSIPCLLAHVRRQCHFGMLSKNHAILLIKSYEIRTNHATCT